MEDTMEGRLNVSIETKHYHCCVCLKPLRSPIFQCSKGHLFCLTCRDENSAEARRGDSSSLSPMCPFCWDISIHQNYGMEYAAKSIRVDCAYAVLGCTQKIIYYDKEEHEAACPHARCFCPASSCSFAGHLEELWEHWVHHPSQQDLPLPPDAKTFTYSKPVDIMVSLRDMFPSWVALRSRDDGQIFILNVPQLAVGPSGRNPDGHAISIACVRAGAKESKYGCSLRFSCFKGHKGRSSLDSIPCSTLSGGLPTDFFCVAPRSPGIGCPITLTVTIVDTQMNGSKSVPSTQMSKA